MLFIYISKYPFFVNGIKYHLKHFFFINDMLQLSAYHNTMKNTYDVCIKINLNEEYMPTVDTSFNTPGLHYDDIYQMKNNIFYLDSATPTIQLDKCCSIVEPIIKENKNIRE